MALSREQSYNILDIPFGASIDDIKQAFRKKAKETHPDINPSPTAHADFIQITEAYMLLTEKPKYTYTTNTYSKTQEDLQREQAARNRARAAHFAKMKYQEFINTPYYKNYIATISLIQHVLLVAFVLCILAPIIGFFINGFIGAGIGFLITLLSFTFWKEIKKIKKNLSISAFINSIGVLSNTHTFWYILVSVVNIYTFFNYTLITEIDTKMLLLSIFSLFAIPLLLFVFIKSKISKAWRRNIIILILPSLFQLFFITNFIFSDNVQYENYLFTEGKEYNSLYGLYTPTSVIELENKAYDSNIYFRFFNNYELIKNKHEILYGFKDGLFGFRVLVESEIVW